MTPSWLSAGFVHRLRSEWTEGVRWRPISRRDMDIDLPMDLENQAMLWAMYGQAWG